MDTTISISKETKKEIKLLANLRGVTMSQLLDEYKNQCKEEIGSIMSERYQNKESNIDEKYESEKPKEDDDEENKQSDINEKYDNKSKEKVFLEEEEDEE